MNQSMLGRFDIGLSVRRFPASARAIGFLLALILLICLSGGWPPRCWLLLWELRSRLPALWSARGPGILLPLTGLSLLALLLALAWLLLLVVAARWLWAVWNDRRERRRFAGELQEAEYLAAQALLQGKRPRVPTVPGQSRTRSPAGSAAATQHLRAAWADFPTQVAWPSSLPSAGAADVEQLDFPEELQETPPWLPVQEQPRPTSTGSPTLRIGALTDPGLKRKQRPNEDYIFTLYQQQARRKDWFGLFVVADGMGGHANGHEASRLVVQTFCEIAVPALANAVENEETLLTDLLVDALQHANLKLYQRNRAEKADMGTTFTAALLLGNTAYVLNIGDSRTYLYRPAAGLTQVTQDHSVVARLLDQGSITSEEIYSHPRRNQIYRCLGDKAAVEVDVFAVSLLPGDKLLLCSDGLWEMVRDPQIERILSMNGDPTALSQCLVQAALDGGGDDNVSVIVVEVLRLPV
jgi:serine/threonine protein phosphatase PrpC